MYMNIYKYYIYKSVYIYIYVCVHIRIYMKIDTYVYE